jgi:hypothetical protein
VRHGENEVRLQDVHTLFGFDSEVEVEAAKGVPYRRLMLRAVQLKCIPAVEEKEYDTMYSIDGVH